MRNKAIVLLVLMLLFNSMAVSAGTIYTLPRQIPASVYKIPYNEDQFTTVYTPWFKNFHLMNENEYNMGRYGGEGCQQVKVMDASPINTDLIYFGTDTTGIWKTTDGGQNWYNVNNNMWGTFTQSIYCDRFDENTVYAYMQRDGAYRSVDGGRTWELLIEDTNKFSGFWTQKFAMDANRNLYIAAGSGIYIMPYGASEPINLYNDYAELTADKSAQFKDIYVSDDGKLIYVAGYYHNTTTPGKYEPGLYISRDLGKTWEIKKLFDNGLTVCTSVTVHPENNEHIFLSAGKYDTESKTISDWGLYQSTDGGATFEKTFVLTYENAEENVSLTEKEFYKLRFGPKNADGIYPLYMAGNQIQYPLRCSLDMGKTFTPMHGRIGAGTFRQRAGTDGDTGWWSQGYAPVMSKPGVVYFAGPGIHKYDNGSIKWCSSGFSGASVTYISMSDEGEMFVTLTDVGPIVSTGKYTKDSYPFFSIPPKKIIITMHTIDPNNKNHIIGFSGVSNTGEKTCGIVESFDGGYTFSDVKDDAVAVTNTYVLKYDKNNPNIIYSSEHTSYDNGKTWKPNEYFIYAISDNDTKKMIGRKGTGKETELYYTDDGGENWTFLFKPGYGDFGHMAFDISDDNIVWYSRLYDFGKIDIASARNESLTSKFECKTFNYFAQNPKNPKHIIVMPRSVFADDRRTDPGCSETTDGGETFHVVPGMWASYSQRIFFSTTTDEAFITGHSGIFIYDYKKYWEFLDSKITVKLNDKEISFSKMPQIVNNRAMVPMRDLFEMLGATISWDEKTQTVTAKRKTKQITLTLNSDTALINNKPVKLDSAPYIDDGKTMIPLRFASEALDINVGWDAEEKIIVIKE